MEKRHQYKKGELVFVEFEYDGLRSFFPVKIIELLEKDKWGFSYTVEDQHNQELTIYEERLFKGHLLENYIKELEIFN